MKSTLRLILLALTLFFSGTTLLWANPPVTSSFQAGALLAQASEEPEEEDTEPEEEDEDEEGEDDFDDEFGDPAEQEIFDPLSGYNRGMTSFNDGFYTYVLDPTARGYRWVVPEGGRRAVGAQSRASLF